MDTPGELIRKWRTRKQYTQQELAERIGRTRVSISRLERDEHTPTLALCRQILDVLDVPDAEAVKLLGAGE